MMSTTLNLAILCLGAVSSGVHAQSLQPPTALQQKLLAATPCDLLASAFPSQVFFPGQKNYTLGESGYWSAQQTDLQPACRFFPGNARQVQEALADVVLPWNVSIAVVSGGQSSVIGASNVHSGITFDLSNIKEVNFFLDAGKASWLGVGNRWKDVYPILEDASLMVTGSQSGNVGVGGHVLGGGLSWFANQYGWATDSVVEIEVVTPQAKILEVSPVKHEDLFWALKGSLGAFGVVTKVKLRTFPHKAVYGGLINYQQKNMPQLCEALDKLAREAERDPTVQGYVNFAWVEAKKDFVYKAYLMDTDGKDTKGAFPQFEAIPHSESTLRAMTVAESAKEIDALNPTGLRRSQFTLTATMDPKTMLALHDIFKEFTHNIGFGEAGVLSVTYQPLTRPHLQAQQNYFNTASTSTPLLLVIVEFWWRDTTKDRAFELNFKDLRLVMQTELQNRKAFHPFVHPGYAAKDQDQFVHLSPLNRKMLKSIKKKYDPDNVWRDIVPGIWHI